MPERKIQVTEYKCQRCSYQWISRTLNEKYKDKVKPKEKDRLAGIGYYTVEGQINTYKKRSLHHHRYHGYPTEWSDEMYVNSKPRFCPKCKTSLWNDEYFDGMEKYLRLKLVGGTWNYNQYGARPEGERYRLRYLYECFLYKIRPTEKELRRVIGYDKYTRYYNGQFETNHGYPPGPFGKNDVKWTNGNAPREERKKNDTAIQNRRECIMLEILKDHGVIITPEEIKKVDEERQKYYEESEKQMKNAMSGMGEYFKEKGAEKRAEKQAMENYYKALLSSTSKQKQIDTKKILK